MQTVSKRVAALAALSLGGASAFALVIGPSNSQNAGSVVRVVSAASPTISGQPATSDAAVTSPTPLSPAPAALAAAPELYTLGDLKWHFAGSTTDAKLAVITDSMNYVTNYYRTLTDITGDVRAIWSSGTPTADAGFRTQIRFGGQMNRRTALHEMTHYLGMGSTTQYGNLVSGGKFVGPLANARVKAFDGDDASLSSNGVHFWPYGMNYDNEFKEQQRTIAMVSAQRADMGWGDAAAAINGQRRFANRASGMVLDSGNGSAPLQQPNGQAASQTWKVDYKDGYIALTTTDGALALDSLGAPLDGSGAAMRQTREADRNQQWDMLPTDDGWFRIRNRNTRKCLDNLSSTAAGTVVATGTCTGEGSQWHLAR